MQFLARCAPNIAEMMQKFGKPCAMYAASPFILDFIDLSIFKEADLQYGFRRIQPTTRILQVYDNPASRCEAENDVGAAWRGFTRYQPASR